jgi:hypothetical protein
MTAPIGMTSSARRPNQAPSLDDDDDVGLGLGLEEVAVLGLGESEILKPAIEDVLVVVTSKQLLPFDTTEPPSLTKLVPSGDPSG